jgi:hypothetical protein
MSFSDELRDTEAQNDGGAEERGNLLVFIMSRFSRPGGSEGVPGLRMTERPGGERKHWISE